jgi:hypothetical protein
MAGGQEIKIKSRIKIRKRIKSKIRIKRRTRRAAASGPTPALNLTPLPPTG